MKKQTTTVNSAPAVWVGLCAVALVAIVAFVAMETKPAKPVARKYHPDTSPVTLRVSTASDVPLSGSVADSLQPQPDPSETSGIPELSAGMNAQALGAPNGGSMQSTSSPLQGSNANPTP
jgi:hypothetical protein